MEPGVRRRQRRARAVVRRPGWRTPYTTLPTVPLTQEKPFLVSQPGGRFRVFEPAVQHDSAGPTWTSGTTADRTIPLGQFFIATPATSVAQINQAASRGKNLLLTPGVYSLDRTIVVQRAHTIVLGLGFPTLVPQGGIEAMRVANVAGVKLSGMIVDAGPQNSKDLVQIGCANCPANSDPNDPTLVQDVFFRIGGASPGRPTTALVVNCLRRRARRHLGVAGRPRRRRRLGPERRRHRRDRQRRPGDGVRAVRRALREVQRDLERRERHGHLLPERDALRRPSQDAWNASKAVKGYPAFLVNRDVQNFTGSGMGSYCFFNQGVDIHATRGIPGPRRARACTCMTCSRGS